MNIDDHKEVAVSRNIQSIPTVLIFKGGRGCQHICRHYLEEMRWLRHLMPLSRLALKTDTLCGAAQPATIE